MEIIETLIADLKLVRSREYEDSRGTFSRSYCMRDFEILIGSRTLKQINLSLTHKIGAIRGLHLQLPPHSELKLVRCLKGTVWDVAVDLRQGSSTFLQWHAEELSEKNKRVLVIPEGFAHGFQTLTSNCEMLYFHTADYKKDSEGAVNAIDPAVAINWPQPITERSERDVNHFMLADDFKGIEL